MLSSVILWIFFTTVPAEANSALQQETFNKALLNYQNKNYQEAQKVFHELHKKNPTNKSILYNLALSGKQNNDPYIALASLVLFLKLDPRSLKAQAGLEDMRQLTQTPKSRSLDILQWIPPFYFLFFLLGVFFLLFAFLKKQRRSRLTYCFLIFAFIFIMAIGSIKTYLLTDPEAIVVDEEADLKSLPLDDAPVLFKLTRGDWVTVKNKKQGWVFIKKQDQAGWLPENRLFPIYIEQYRKLLFL